VPESREPDTGWVDAPRRLIPPLDLADLELPPVEIPGGLLLPIPNSSPGYFYVSTSSVWFELMMAEDSDVAVRLLGSMRLLLPGGEVHDLDAAASRRSTLEPLFRLKDHEVTAGRATDGGDLRIDFGDDRVLLASSARDFGWEVIWPHEWPSWWVVGRDGRIEVNGAHPDPPVAAVASASSTPQGASADGEALPIQGPIDQLDVSDSTIELESGADSTGGFCIHFAGPTILTMGGRRESIDGVLGGRQKLGPMLDILGRAVVGASMDERRLSLDLDDGTTIHTLDDSWEAHWGENLEEWAPEMGPRFP
jgi:hypothetical protein